MTLDVSTNVECKDLRGVDIVVGSAADTVEERAALSRASTPVRFASATTTACRDGVAPRSIGTLVITPDSDFGAVVVIAAFGNAKLDDCMAPPRFAAECIVARRRFTFASNRALTLPVVLDPECAGVLCSASTTCVGKRCIPAEVDCSGDVCSQPGVVPGGNVDGSTPLDDSGDASRQDGADAPADAPPGGRLDCPASSPFCTEPGGGPVATQCVSNGPTVCCYAGGSPSCIAPSACNDLSGCCRDANDCPTGQVCCADTPTPTTSTQIRCRPQAQCASEPLCSPNHPVCVQGVSMSCTSSRTYALNFYGCS